MDPLDEQDLSDLAAFREVYGPSAGQRRANFDAVASRVEQERVPQRRLGPWVAVAVLAAAAVLVWVWLRPEPMLETGGRVPQEASDRAVQGETAAALRREAVAKPDAIANERAPATSPQENAPRTPAHKPAAPPPREALPQRPPTRPAQATGSVPADQVRAEARLMRQVRHALEADDDRSALQLLDRHRAEFSNPFMEEEAAAWRAVATCRTRGASGKALARAFARSFPRSPHRTAVRDACGEDSLTAPDVPMQRVVGDD